MDSIYVSKEEIMNDLLGESVAEKVHELRFSKVALIGIKIQRQESFLNSFKKRGIEVFVPDEKSRAFIDRVIFDELCYRTIDPVSEAIIISIVKELKRQGAEALVLGSRLGMIISKENVGMPIFNTYDESIILKNSHT
jgi:aspartate racemase